MILRLHSAYLNFVEMNVDWMYPTSIWVDDASLSRDVSQYHWTMTSPIEMENVPDRSLNILTMLEMDPADDMNETLMDDVDDNSTDVTMVQSESDDEIQKMLRIRRRLKRKIIHLNKLQRRYCTVQQRLAQHFVVPSVDD